jgi:hypothetical protein
VEFHQVLAADCTGSLALLAKREELRKKDFVYVTPLPALTRLDRAHDRMLGLMEVFGCVLVLGGVAAADVPATEAHPEMNPGVAHFQAFFTTFAAGCDVVDLFHMRTGFLRLRHVCSCF